MHKHVCRHIFDFIFNKVIIFLNLNAHKIHNSIKFTYFKLMQILGCDNSTPLKMNLVLEIRTMLTQKAAGMFSSDPFLFPKQPHLLYTDSAEPYTSL